LSHINALEESISLLTKSSPGLFSEWSLWVDVVLIDDLIPNGMEFFGSIVGLENEIITTSVTTCMSFGISVANMKWLMYVTIKVDKKTESNG